jgi:2-C-methyl-D-erythritol 2,4-cyclodiphosphate synthase
MRIGYGYDVHQLVKGKKLLLGGEHIPFVKGLLGHSDADVLIHAICDALLGAAGLGDIGMHFPDTDHSLKDIKSLILLKKTYNMVHDSGFSIFNIDSTIIAQAPNLSPYRDAMRLNLATCTGMKLKDINIKFTTSEGLGFIGEERGIAAVCVALIG